MGAKTLIKERKRAKRFGTGEKEDGKGKEKEEGFGHLGMGSGPRKTGFCIWVVGD